MAVIKAITPAGYETWNRYVRGHASGGVYLTTAWKEAVERGYGHQAFYLAAYSSQIVVGVLPLIFVKPPLSKGSLVSLPFCDYGGLLADDDGIAHALLEHGLALANKFQTCLEIRTPLPCSVLANDGRFTQVTNKCRMLFDLPGSAAALWTSFKSKLRSQVNRAVKDGLVCRLGQRELLPDFYRVFSRNMRDLGSPVHSVAWLREIIEAYGEYAKVGVVYKGDLPIAAGIILAHQDTMTIPWASTLREYNKFSPNMLLYWTLLEYAAEHGFRFFDFGRSTPEEGTYVFKKQWGADPVPLFWYSQITKSHRKTVGCNKSSMRYAIERVWVQLPMALANSVGPRLRKYIDK